MTIEQDIEKLEQQKKELQNKINQKKNTLGKKKRKERNAALIRGGIIIEQMLKNGKTDKEKMTGVAKEHLKERDLEIFLKWLDNF